MNRPFKAIPLVGEFEDGFMVGIAGELPRDERFEGLEEAKDFADALNDAYERGVKDSTNK